MMPVGSIDWIVSETASNGTGLAQYNVQEIYQAQTPTTTGGGMYTSNWASGILSQQLTAISDRTLGTPSPAAFQGRTTYATDNGEGWGAYLTSKGGAFLVGMAIIAMSGYRG